MGVNAAIGIYRGAASRKRRYEELIEAAWPVAQVIGPTRWVGAGRKLTQTGRLTMNDARALVELLQTELAYEHVRYPVCELLATLADPKHNDHEDMRSWLGLDPGHDFDPDRFDLDEANRRLRAASLGAYAN